MERIVGVGGGVAGEHAANVVNEQGGSFRGLERSDVLGGDLAVGHHRFYNDGVRSFFSAVGITVQWKFLDEAPEELKKGKMTPVAMEEFTAGQRHFLGARFFVAQTGY